MTLGSEGLTRKGGALSESPRFGPRRLTSDPSFLGRP